MPRIRLEADTPERTQIGEALVRFAVRAGRLETGRPEGRYFLQHADGCGDCDRPVRPGETFVFDTDAGEVLCPEDAERRADAAEAGED